MIGCFFCAPCVARSLPEECVRCHNCCRGACVLFVGTHMCLLQKQGVHASARGEFFCCEAASVFVAPASVPLRVVGGACVIL